MISLRNKIGQMLIMGFSGTTLTEQSPIVHWLKNDGLGGVLLFDYDLKSQKFGLNLLEQSQIKHLTHQLNQFSEAQAKSTHGLPLFTAIDYEGGAVDRLKKIEGCMQTMSAAQQAQLSESEFIEEITEMADTLKLLGFNLNFAPVVDLNLSPAEGIIGPLNRSFSSNAGKVSRLASDFVQIFNQKGIACAYKHFPGHGSASTDTHHSCVDVSKTFNKEELMPYQHLQQHPDDALMIMTAHVINRSLDDSGLPATLSYKMLTQTLRQELGYQGVIIGDDMQMKAIAAHYELEEALALTINAGADMLIFGNQLGSITAPEVIDRIEGLVKKDKISVDRINDAYSRVVRLKSQLLA